MTSFGRSNNPAVASLICGFLVVGCGGTHHEPRPRPKLADASVSDAGNDAGNDAGTAPSPGDDVAATP